MIESFYVNNYKCLVDVRIPLTPIHVIIGQNDSGKTSVLEAMLALSRSTRMRLDTAFPGEWEDRELVNDGAEKPIIEFEVHLASDEIHINNSLIYHVGIEFTRSRQVWCIEEWVQNGSPSQVTQWGAGWTCVGNRGSMTLAPPLREHLDKIARSLEPTSLYRFDPQLMAMPAAINPSRKYHMDPDGFGLATLLDDILGHGAERFLILRREFCTFFPQFRSVRIESVVGMQRTLQDYGLHVAGPAPGKGIFFEMASGRTIRAQQASDGAILFLGLLALIHSPEPPKLLLIEEPEKGVYPKRLEEIIGLIRRLQEDPPSGRAAPQIIMTTHSPYLLSSFRPEEVTLMVRRDGGKGPVEARPLRDAPNIEERLGRGEFYLGELWYNLSEDELFAHADT